ncbi:MAG: NADH:ubiquinone reductase (Na(+)-transporting) subunit A [Muribaculaceae bacterium]|nr:NADH:ubiquinone reductase (Na(+)-transporting) subunit A [Muribaculaceae bacterium]MDE6523523.1 NADH:ubiquinone reductase (Na(+)-transporting) subunit A [Muribaculaceae bacterium]
MAIEINIKKGLDIPMEGKAEGKPEPIKATLVGICPEDFPGYTWKCDVKPGDAVTKGMPLFHAKEAEAIKLVSPAAGTVEEIRRGERRKILAVTVRVSEEDSKNPIEAGSLIEKLKQSGLWAMMRQRPFDVVPAENAEPRDIFVTAFDSSPLAGNVIPTHIGEYLEPGLEALKSLTKGTVYLAVRPGQGLRTKVAKVLDMIGPHPAGNVGVQIAAVAPINKGETVWTLDAGTVARLGMLVKKGYCDYRAEVAITGPAAVKPKKVLTEIGASLNEILKGELKEDTSVRVISGNVLTGTKVNPETDFLRFPYRQITIIEEGDKADEFMGWASMSPKKFSIKRTFPAFLRGLEKPFNFDARIKGGHRAMILSGELDKVFPFDIYPEYLIKAMMAGDYDRMEKLGIYEVAPEDFALPEFVDTSKQELQKLTRESLEKLRKDS